MRRRPSNRDGFIVVAALWILAVLAGLASVAAAYISQSAAAVSFNDDAVQSEMLVKAGVTLAAYRLSTSAGADRPTHGTFDFKLAKSDVAVEFMSESARINLNMAPKAMIAGLFATLGVNARSADQLADRVIGWRSATQNDEEGLYRAAGVDYGPRRAPFNSVDELWLVLDLPPAVVEHALPFLTVYSGMAEVNVLDAEPEVVAALPTMTPARLDAFLSGRESLPRDPQLVLAALGGATVGATTAASNAYRVRVRIPLSNGRRRTSEVVIMMTDPGLAVSYQVLAWRDDVDGP